MHNKEPFNKGPRIMLEQDVDPVLLNFKEQTLGLPFDEQILAKKHRYMHYCRKEKRIKIEDDIL